MRLKIREYRQMKILIKKGWSVTWLWNENIRDIVEQYNGMFQVKARRIGLRL